MIAPRPSIPDDDRTDPLSDLRQLVSLRPEALYLDAVDLARQLGCTPFEAEEARRWIIEDGFEVAA